MSRFQELLDKYQDQEETDAEAEELAGLLKEDDYRARTFYDALMLEVDLYESYAGIARIQAAPRRRWRLRQWVPAWAVAVLLIVGLVAVLTLGAPRTAPVAPGLPAAPRKIEAPPPAPEPPKPVPPPGKRVYREKEDHEEHPEHEGHEKEGRQAEIEREYQKGLREVERKREQGKTKEAEEKLREIQRERDRKLNGRERRGDD